MSLLKTLLPFTLLAAAGACNDHGSTPEPFGQPISGGTMMISADGNRAVIADPDRDRIVTMDLNTGVALQELALDPGDEPGRLVEDAQGFVHVALRRGGAVITLDATGKQVNKRFACTEPRGIAFDSAQNLLHVACAGGELVSFGEGAAPVRSLRLERDLRDVIVQGANLVVTKFRTAEILTIDAGGNIVNRAFPPTVRRFDNGFFGGADLPPDGVGEPGSGIVDAAASTAWRTIALKDGRLVMTHQRKTKDTLDTEQTGGYGGNCGGGPVEDAVTVVAPGEQPRAARRFGKGALPVDIAVSPTNDKIALVVAGSRNIVVTNRAALDESDGEENEPCEPPKPPECDGDDCCDDTGGGGSEPPVDPNMGEDTPAPAPRICENPCQDDNLDGRCDDPEPGEGGGGDRLGAPTSVAWTPAGDLVIFYPEAPAIVVRKAGAKAGQRRIAIGGKAAFDPGRNVFHQQTAIGLACASCHPEGRDDGLTWNFAQLGMRRTQSIAGNILDRAPYHWAGDEATLPKLMDDVFSTRMAGGFLTDNEKAALGPWMNRIPAPPAGVVNADASARGAVLFEQAGCATCHAAGDKGLFTDNRLVNVGTGGKFKVPSLVGVGARAPFMHDGCAQTLMDRFTKCGGGDLHGATSALSQTQLTDLVEYLESL